MFEKIFASMDEIKKETVEICAMQNGCEDCPFYRYTCTGFTLLNDLQDQCNVLKSLERDWNCKHHEENPDEGGEQEGWTSNT